MTGCLLPQGVDVLERGWLSSNTVILHGANPAEGAVIVDTGYATHASQTLALVAATLRPRETVRLIANTHLHSDHCGGNAALVDVYHCPILTPPGDFQAAERWDEQALTFAATGQRCTRFIPTGKLLPGERLRHGGLAWEIHAAPGHDPHSVMLYEPQSGTLLSADALWERGFGIVFPELDGCAAFDEVDATLKLIKRLAPRVIIPGHGAPFWGIDEALRVAHSRLKYFRENPPRHAASAAKALTVFHVLEVATVLERELINWLCATPIIQTTHATFFREVPLEEWAKTLLNDLLASETLKVQESSDGRLIHVS